MRVISLFVLAGTLSCVTSERHSLTYIYTALSKSVKNPGIHEFTAMGLLDTKMIDYFDSDLQEKIPKKSWMKERLNPDYWTKGTESRKSKQQWFKVNLDILKDRMNQTDDDIHVLQWMHGCEADLVPDDSAPSGKSLQFQRGIDQYSYDGNSFLYFDDAHGVWVAAATAAEPTKRKWDEVQVLKDYTKGYLEKECLNWLEKFMDYGKAQLQHAAPPEVYIFASNSKVKSNVLLTCMATGFYPPDIVLNFRRNGRVLMEEDGVMTTGIRPNEDDTYQRRDSIQILRTDTADYTCEVNHAATNVSIRMKWDHVLPELEDDVGGVPVGALVGGVIGVLLFLIGAVVVVVLVKKHLDQREQPDVVPDGPPGRVNVADPRPLENNLLIPQAQHLEEDPLIPQDQHLEEDPLIPQDQHLEEDPLIPQAQHLEEDPLIPQAQHLEEDPLIPQDQHLEEDPVIPQAQPLEENSLIRQDQHLEEDPVIPQAQPLEEDPVIPQDQPLEENPVIPQAQPLEENSLIRPAQPLEKDPLIRPNDDDSSGKGSSDGSSDGSSESLDKGSGGSLKSSDSALGSGEE